MFGRSGGGISIRAIVIIIPFGLFCAIPTQALPYAIEMTLVHHFGHAIEIN